MDSRSAQDHLRVIRELMERATIYRTISVPAALVCGCLALIVALVALVPSPLQTLFRPNFVRVWFVVFLLSAASNTLFLLRSARLRKESFPSPRLRTTLLAIAPAFLVAGSLTVLLAQTLGSEIFIAICWIALYGVALLSTLTFAPRSIVILGWAFVVTSCLGLILLPGEYLFFVPMKRYSALAELGYFAMAATFGLYHIIYGLAVTFYARRYGNG